MEVVNMKTKKNEDRRFAATRNINPRCYRKVYLPVTCVVGWCAEKGPARRAHEPEVRASGNREVGRRPPPPRGPFCS